MAYGRKRTYRRRAQTTKSSNQKASKKYVKSVVAKAVRSDPHYFDTSIGGSPCAAYNAAMFAAGMLAIPQGDTQQSRTGKKIQLTGIQLKMSMYRSVSSSTHDRLRILLVRVQNQDSVLNINNLYNDLFDTTLCTIDNAQQAFRKIRDGQVNNFHILKSWMVDLGYGTTDKSTRVLSYNKRFKRPLSVWYDTSSTVQPVRNGLYLIAVSDSATALPALAAQMRVTFLP